MQIQVGQLVKRRPEYYTSGGWETYLRARMGLQPDVVLRLRGYSTMFKSSGYLETLDGRCIGEYNTSWMLERFMIALPDNAEISLDGFA